MERSSPLAALRPTSLPMGHWAYQKDVPASYSNCGAQYEGKIDIGPCEFNFNDLSMTQTTTDYFDLKPIRGSSPTTTLAADLSQNFYIDRSPQFVTPRRSLFSRNLFGTMSGRECVTTPPLPSSSPVPGNDSMEMSPLPHKAPFVAPKIQLTSAEVTDVRDLILSLPNIDQETPEIPPDCSNQSIPYERRRRRPSLSHSKVHSFSSVPLKNNRSESLLPAFKFGNGPATSTLMSTDDSPLQLEKTSSTPLAIGLPRPKQPFAVMHGHVRGTGSPIVGHVRKPCMVNRPRKQFRRSLSMFEQSADFLKQDKVNVSPTGALDSIMDIDDTPKLHLPHFTADEESLPRITKSTMIDILDGKYCQNYDRSIVIDCRFEYEYNGGHIDGAINVNSKEDLADTLFDSGDDVNTLLIFHCEYSAHRAPIMAKFIRNRDRAANVHHYPRLTYPEVYILDGGYSSFFMDHRYRCFPQNYVEMAAKEHVNACERGLGKMKQQRAKLSRAQTFAFGQHNQPMDDSPTAPHRQGSSSSLMMEIETTTDLSLESKRLHSRRMASY